MTVGELKKLLDQYPDHRRVIVSVNDFGKQLIVTGYALDIKVQEINDDMHPLNSAIWILGERNQS